MLLSGVEFDCWKKNLMNQGCMSIEFNFGGQKGDIFLLNP